MTREDSRIEAYHSIRNSTTSSLEIDYSQQQTSTSSEEQMSTRSSLYKIYCVGLFDRQSARIDQPQCTFWTGTSVQSPGSPALGPESRIQYIMVKHK